MATYSGDSNYAGSSARLTQVVNQPISATGPPEVEVGAGGTATYTVIVTSLNGFFGTVALSCSGAPSDGACSFAQSTLTLAARGSASTTMTVTTTTADALLRRGEWNRGVEWGRIATDGESNRNLIALASNKSIAGWATGLGISVLAFFLLSAPPSRKKSPGKDRAMLPPIAAATILLLGLTSCGCPVTRHQEFVIAITGTSSATGTPISQSTSVELVVH